MKILYSQIKDLVPGVKAEPREIGEILTMIGFMMDSLEEVQYLGKKDYLLSLEVRQNRADCLSVLGLAREIAAYYGLEVRTANAEQHQEGTEDLNIKVLAKDKVRRILAVKLNKIENNQSPSWLADFLSFYQIKSVNLLVDLSNYVMVLTGYPSHILDAQKISGPITWMENGKSFSSTKTLDGTSLELKKGNELIISDEKNVLALAGIVGSQTAAITEESSSVVVEMALYDSALIRENARTLRIATEAGNRLEKDLDANSLKYAFNLLIGLITKHCKGCLASNIFHYYPHPQPPRSIVFDPCLPSVFAGINISPEKSIDILKNLRFVCLKEKRGWNITPPSDRIDILLEEDLVEEVVRMVRFDTIPADETPALQITTNITPPLIRLTEKARDVFSTLGYDEILSWPMTTAAKNLLTNHLNWDSITTQNSVNDECPDLRQSIAASLLLQEEEYHKKNIEFIDIFEIGKVFGKEGKKYAEYEFLGVLSRGSQEKTLQEFRKVVEVFFRSLGIGDIEYTRPSAIPKTMNAHSSWGIAVQDKSLGIIGKLKPPYAEGGYFAEINLSALASIIGKFDSMPAVELNQKLVALDANVELEKNESIEALLKHASQKIGESRIWDLRVTDAYPINKKIRYTVRATYREMNDQDAKSLHLKVFNLATHN